LGQCEKTKHAPPEELQWLSSKAAWRKNPYNSWINLLNCTALALFAFGVIFFLVFSMSNLSRLSQETEMPSHDTKISKPGEERGAPAISPPVRPKPKEQPKPLPDPKKKDSQGK
jgi:hypothetical protein